MLWNLKQKIYEKFETQWLFSIHIKEQPTYVSQVIREHRILPVDKKIKWARALDCSVDELFEA